MCCPYLLEGLIPLSGDAELKEADRADSIFSCLMVSARVAMTTGMTCAERLRVGPIALLQQ